MSGISTLLSGSSVSFIEKFAGVAGLFVIAYLLITSVVGLFRRPEPALLPPAPVIPDAILVDQAQSAPQTIARTTGRSVLIEIVETIVMTVLIFAAVRLLVQNFRIEGNSMEPNLHDGQYLIIEKVSYRLGQPQRGDVIVFHYPSNPRRDFIKRIIGLPGESVQVRGGVVHVNGVALDEEYGPHTPAYNFGPETVGAGEYFVLGDNRNNSSDSHSWGMLPRDLIIGRAWMIYWPVSDWGMIPHFDFSRQLSLAPPAALPAEEVAAAWLPPEPVRASHDVDAPGQ